MRKSAYQKLLIRNLPQLVSFIFALHAWKRLGSYEKYQNIDRYGQKFISGKETGIGFVPA